MSTPDQLIYKAAALLDTKGDAERAEAVLREAIRVSSTIADFPHLAEAKTFLGEVLAHAGRDDEALAEFEDVIEIGQSEMVEFDLIDPFLLTARAFVAKAKGLE